MDLKEYRKQYYELNKEKVREYTKKYKEQNKEKIKEYRKEYYEQNKEKLKEYQKQYSEQNKEKAKEYSKKYYEQNKEKIKEHRKKYRKQYYKQNKEKAKEYNKKYCEQNNEKIKELHKQYREQNKEKIKELHKQYRGRYALARIVMLDDDSSNLLIYKFETISTYLGVRRNNLLKNLILSFYDGDFLSITALITSIKNQLDFNSVLNTKFKEIENRVFNKYKDKKKIKIVTIRMKKDLYNDILKRSHERFHSKFSKIVRDLMKAFVTLDTNKFTEYVDLIVGTRKEE